MGSVIVGRKSDNEFEKKVLILNPEGDYRVDFERIVMRKYASFGAF
jgi:hypothetical protein